MSRPTFPDAGLAGQAKLDAVAELMNKLTIDAGNVIFMPDERDEALEKLKMYGRDAENADPIFTREGIETLTKHAFFSPSRNTARQAYRCIANAMLLKPQTRQFFVDLGLQDRACRQLRNESWDDEFLVGRILFLTTYDTTIDLDVLVTEHHLGDIVCHNLGRHAKLLGRSGAKGQEDPMEEAALAETLRLIFNVTSCRPDGIESFAPAVPHIVALLWKRDVSPERPLDPPFGPLVNALLNLGLDDDKARAALFPEKNPNTVVERLVEILAIALRACSDAELECHATPLVGVLRRLYDVAPESVREHMKATLLPTTEDRNDVLGKSRSTTSLLLRNSTNPMTPNLREVVAELLFELSDEDTQKFVDNVGYGFASGLLFRKNLIVPGSASEAFGTGGGAAPPVPAAGAGPQPVNPITGQFLDKEKAVQLPDMSDDEKMREAERLFVLFERLKQNGLIDVQSPLRTAVEEGRFEELPDDAEDLD